MNSFEETIQRIEQKQARRRSIARDLGQMGFDGRTDARVISQLCAESANLEDEISELVNICTTFGKPTDDSMAAKKESIMSQLQSEMRIIKDQQSKLTPAFGSGSDSRLNAIVQLQINHSDRTIADLRAILRLI